MSWKALNTDRLQYNNTRSGKYYKISKSCLNNGSMTNTKEAKGKGPRNLWYIACRKAGFYRNVIVPILVTMVPNRLSGRNPGTQYVHCLQEGCRSGVYTYTHYPLTLTTYKYVLVNQPLVESMTLVLWYQSS